MSSAASPEQEASRGGRLASRILIVIATLLTVIAIFAVWCDRQMLNASNWADTSTSLLKNDKIRASTATYLTDQIYKNVNVQAEVEKALPSQAQILAGPAASELRTLAQNGIDQALATSAVQQIWRSAQKALATQVIDVVNEKNTGFLQYQGNNVQLDLRQAAIDIGSKIGLKSQAEKIPAGQATVTVFTAKQIGQVRTVAQFLQAVALLFPLLAILFYGLAVYLNRGRRRRTVVVASCTLILAALIALATRGIAEGIFLDAINPTVAFKPSAEATWSIATEMLQSIAVNTILMAVLFILISTLGGPWKFAVGFRRWVAPWTNGRPGVAYGVAFAVLLLFLVWGPIPATRQWLMVLIFIALTGIAVFALRKETLVEFPNATADDAVARLGDAVTEM